MADVKIGPYDLTITQNDGVYVVSGKDAEALHEKMQGLPEDAQDLIVGDIDAGQFTLQKRDGAAAPA
ncbi:MAG: hypothetical protein ACN2B6_09605 [Rickettsiales bacterium]